MNITKISVSRTVKVNIGNYQSTDIAVTYTAELEEFDNDIDACTRELYSKTREAVVKQVELLPNRESPVDSFVGRKLL